MKHPDTGKFMPDDFNVTEIEERDKWEATRPHLGCGVCRMVVGYTLNQPSVQTTDEDALFSFLESVCEAPDDVLFFTYEIVPAASGAWDAVPTRSPDERRVDIRKWQSLSLRDTCVFTVLPNDDALVSAIQRTEGRLEHAERVEHVCTKAKLCRGGSQLKDET